MKRLINLLLIVLIIIVISCNNSVSSVEDAKWDSFKQTPADRHKIDSMTNGTIKNYILKDTLSVSSAPVKIISAHPVSEEYSNYKNISVTFKNVSGKNIEGIKFNWYGVNAFKEPAQMGGITEGFGGGFTDEKLRAGKTSTSTWSILSRDLKKVVKAWPTEVVFEDGTKWKSGDQN